MECNLQIAKHYLLNWFRPNELAFIKEYCCVMQPLANALDILQAELKCFFGYILPTLTSLRCKLTAMKPNLKIAVPLVDAILDGLNSRFEGFETRADALLSTVTLPQFRLRWLEDTEKKNQV
jgi:hypothetical protein